MKRNIYAAFAITAGAALTVAACGATKNDTDANALNPAPTPTPVATLTADAPRKVLTGREALGDWSTDAPGVRRKLTVSDLPPPFDTPSVDNGPKLAPRPAGTLPKAPEGFAVNLFTDQVSNPRVIVTAPNGDLFVSESRENRVKVLRDSDGDGKAETAQVFATGLRQPFGIAFYPVGPNPQYVYIANTDSVVRYPYKNGDLTASGPQSLVTNTIPGGGQLRGGGHWTRDIVFSRDGKKMFVSVGSRSNVDEKDSEEERSRALIFEFNPDGTNGRIYASGIRNPVGLAIDPSNGALWTSVNERDGLGDHLVPDYVTRVKEGGFYGWPWFYIGPNEDPRKKGMQPELKNTVLVPDVLLQSHSASLDMAFYDGNMFPGEYKGHAFAAEHGSWNRERRTGYKVVRIPVKGGKATGEYEDFLTGFVLDQGQVWGRPVGVTTARDGALLVTDDGSNTVWRVAYVGKGKAKKTASR